ncbi:unnamed protein product, partial [Onchocerca flexuosa]|uniref:PORR domain-containing protein n=2 Tax=Onchocerca flexuosa TaxID=387005 RepID=A0A183HP55_9BILA
IYNIYICCSFPITTESDLDSETSVVNFVHQRPTTIPTRGRKRGRPPKTDNAGRNTPSYVHISEMLTELDLAKWNPDRVCSSSQFILMSRVSRILMMQNHRELLTRYPTIFRYNSDEMDRKWLINHRFTARLNGEIYLLLLNDAAEIAIAEGL